MISALQCLIEYNASIEYMYGPMAGVGANIKKLLPKYMDWEVATMVVHTINNIFESIKLNQTTVEKLMLYQTAEELFELYVIMSKGTVPKVLKNIPRKFIRHMVKTIRRYVIFSKTWKTNIWKCLRLRVKIFCPSCNCFRVQE